MIFKQNRNILTIKENKNSIQVIEVIFGYIRSDYNIINKGVIKGREGYKESVYKLLDIGK